MRDLARHSSVFLHEMCGITLQRVFQFHWRHQFFGVLPSYSIVVSIVNCYWIHFPNGWCVLCMSVILSSLARRGMIIAILQFAFIDSLRWHRTNIQLRQYLGSELTPETPHKLKWWTVQPTSRPTSESLLPRKMLIENPNLHGFIIQLKQFGPKAQLKFTSLLQSSYHQYCFQSSLPICCLLPALYLNNKVMPGEKTLFIRTCLVLYVPADWPLNQWTLVETSCSVSLWVSMII